MEVIKRIIAQFTSEWTSAKIIFLSAATPMRKSRQNAENILDKSRLMVIMETCTDRGGEKNAEKEVLDHIGFRRYQTEEFVSGKPVYGRPYEQNVTSTLLDDFLGFSVLITESKKYFNASDGTIITIPAGAYFCPELGFYFYDIESNATQKLCIAVTEDGGKSIELTRTGDAPTVTPDDFYVKNTENKEGLITWEMTGNNTAALNLECSLDGDAWIDVTIGAVITLPANGKLYFRGNNPEGLTAENGESYLSLSGTVTHKVGGDVTTLINKYGGVWKLDSGYEFAHLFSADTNLTDAGALALPTEELSKGCYADMFYGCPALTAVPQLPATVLAEDCYADMFYGCTNLETAPERRSQIYNANVLATR